MEQKKPPREQSRKFTLLQDYVYHTNSKNAMLVGRGYKDEFKYR